MSLNLGTVGVVDTFDTEETVYVNQECSACLSFYDLDDQFIDEVAIDNRYAKSQDNTTWLKKAVKEFFFFISKERAIGAIDIMLMIAKRPYFKKVDFSYREVGVSFEQYIDICIEEM